MTITSTQWKWNWHEAFCVAPHVLMFVFFARNTDKYHSMEFKIKMSDATLTRRVFLKQFGLGAAGIGLAGLLPEAAWALPRTSIHLPRSLPEAQGVSSSGLLSFVESAEAGRMNLH